MPIELLMSAIEKKDSNVCYAFLKFFPFQIKDYTIRVAETRDFNIKCYSAVIMMGDDDLNQKAALIFIEGLLSTSDVDMKYILCYHIERLQDIFHINIGHRVLDLIQFLKKGITSSSLTKCISRIVSKFICLNNAIDIIEYVENNQSSLDTKGTKYLLADVFYKFSNYFPKSCIFTLLNSIDTYDDVIMIISAIKVSETKQNVIEAILDILNLNSFHSTDSPAYIFELFSKLSPSECHLNTFFDAVDLAFAENIKPKPNSIGIPHLGLNELLFKRGSALCVYAFFNLILNLLLNICKSDHLKARVTFFIKPRLLSLYWL